MATNGGQIKFGVGFNVDKSGLNDLEKSLKNLYSMAGKEAKIKENLGAKEAQKEMIEVQRTVLKVQDAFKNAFNSKLGTTNVAKLNSELKKIKLDKIKEDFSRMGAAGQIAFNNIATKALTTNKQLKQTHTTLDKMAETLGNTLKWNISSGAINRMTGAIQEAYGFTKSLDSSLNDIMIVTGKNADEMERFAQQANKAAKNLATGTTDYTKASLIYYQQGLSDEEVAARTDTTIKVANVTGQSADTVSQNLTAVWNGYKVSAEEAETYIDKLSAVAATTAADLDGLSTGMSKVASAANLMGVDVDQLNATLATVISVTQQAPESVGTAFKTIYARMGDIEAGLDTETTLGEYTSKVKEIAGVNVLDANNQLRDMGEVIEEIGGKWTTLSREQQIALSQAMAGTRQYNNLLSLFDNWDMYTETLNESANAAGTLQEQQDTYMESTEAHLQQMRTSFEDLYMSLLDAESINNVADILSKVAEGFTNFIDAIGGGQGALLMFGSIAARVFSKNIAQGIATTIKNFQIARNEISQTKAKLETLKMFKGEDVADDFVDKLVEMKKQVLSLGDLVTAEQDEQANALIKTTNEINNQAIAWKENLEQANNFLNQNTRIDEDVKIDFKDFGTNDEEKDKAEKALKQIENRIKYNSKALDNAKDKIKKYYKTFEEAEIGKKSFEEEAEARQEANEEIEKSIEALIKQNQNIEFSEEVQNELNKALEEYRQILESDDQSAILNAGKNVLDVYSKINEDIQNGVKETRQVIDEEANGASEKFEEASEKAKEDFEEFVNGFKVVKIVKGFVDLAAGVGEVASGINSLINIYDIWNNEELTTGEKTLQIFMALGSAIPMLIQGFGSIWSIMAPLIAKLAGVAAGELTVTVAAKAMWKAITGPVGLAIAGIAAVGVAIYALVKAHNASMDAAIEANKAAKAGYEEATNAARAAKEAYDELANSFDAYKEAMSSLEGLTKGTKEYEDALKKANEEALKLLELVPELAKYIKRDEEGNIYFSKDGEKAVEEAAKRAEEEAEKANRIKEQGLINQIESAKKEAIQRFLHKNEAEDDYTKSQLEKGFEVVSNKGYNSLRTRDDVKEYLAAIRPNEDFDKAFLDNSGALNDYALGLLEPFFDQEEGSEIFKLKDDAKSFMKNLEEPNSRIDALYKDLLIQKQSDVYDAYGLSAEGRERAAKKFQEQYGIEQSYDDVYSNIKSEYSKEQIFQQVASRFEKEGYKYDKEEEILKDSSGNEVDIEAAMGLLADAMMEENVGVYNSDALTEEEETQAEALGYIKKDGQWTKNGENVEIEEIKNSLFNEWLIDIANIETRLDNFGKQYNITTDAIKKGSKDLSNIFNNISLKDLKELKSLSKNELIAQLGLTSEDLQELGYEGVDDWYQSFQEGLENVGPLTLYINQKLVTEEKTDSVENALNELSGGAETLSEETVKALEEQYQNINWDELLNQPISVIYDELNKLQNQNIEDLKEITDLGIEIKTRAALELPEDAIENYKNEIEVLEEQLNGFEDMKKRAEEKGWDTSAYDETISNIKNQIKDLKTTIKDVEEYTELENAIIPFENAVMEAYEEFDLLANGMDKLVSNSEKMATAAAMIGEGFLVAAEDAEKFLTLYPELASQADILESGELQLNEEIVKSYIDGQSDMLAANLEVHKQSIQNKIDTLEMELAYKKAQRDVLDAYILGTKTKAEKDEELQKIKQEYAEDFDEANKKADENQAQSASNTITNLNSIGEVIEQVSKAYEKMLTGEVVEYTPEEIKMLTGGLVNTSESFDIGDIVGRLSAVEDREQLNKEIATTETVIAGYKKQLLQAGKVETNISKGRDAASGKGGKENSKDNIDYLNKEVDLYREVNLELAKQEKLLNKLKKQQDKLNGKDLIDNLNKQLFVIEKQKQALIEKASIAKKEAQAHRDSLETQGVQFNEEGYITNYDEMLKYKEDYLIRVTEKYNSLSETEQKEYKQYVEAAQNDYDAFKESMDRYTDLWSEEIPSYVEEFEDKLDEEIEINITKFNYEVELTLNLDEAKRQWNDFRRNVLLDEDDTSAMSQSYLDDMTTYEKDAFKSSEQAINIQKEIDIINAGGSSKIYGKDLTAAMDDLEKQHQASMNAVQGAKSAAEQSRQLWLSGIDDSINELNETAEVYDTLSNLYNHDMNMVTMLYGDDEYEKINNIYKQKQANDIEELNNIKEREKHYKQMMDAETDPEAKEKWKNAWLSTINELTSKTEEAVKTVLDQHANAVKKTIEEMNEQILPKDKNGRTMSLELIGEEWDLIREEGERYLDDIEVGFAVQDFQNSFEDAFDATDSIAGQNKLNKVYQEQLDILKDKDKLSQYELERAQAMLDITLKEIALEEARQNKNSMRLRRDAQGNYSYQYVEDEDAIKDAEKDLQDAQKGLYQLDKEKYLEDVQYVYDKTKELEDKIIELYNDTSLTNEEREQKKALLIEQYAPQIESATKKVEESKVNLGNSTKIAMSAIGDEIVKDFVGSEGVGTLPEIESGMAQFVENMSKEGGMKSILETTFSNLDTVLDNTEQSIKDIETAAEADFDTIGIDNVGTNADDSKTKVNELKDSVSDLITEESTELKVLKDLHLQSDIRLNDLIGTESQLRKNIEATQDYIEATKQAQIENAKLANSQKANPSDTARVQTPSSAKLTPAPQKTPDVEPASGSGGGNGDGDDNPSSDLSKSPSETPSNLIGKKITFTGLDYYNTNQDIPGGTSRYRIKNTVRGGVEAEIIEINNKAPRPIRLKFLNKNSDYFNNKDNKKIYFNKGWVSEEFIKYKTGGLVDKTGPAWLDGTKSKPELVLNSSDTAKLLETVKILRTKTSIAKSLEQATMDRLSDKLSAEMKKMSDMMKATSAIANAKSELSTLEQKVSITADFPNVSDSKEIEEAFNNLINVASQYAYRNV